MPNVAEAILGKHKSVLLKESIDALDLSEGEILLDGTIGSGGHSAEAAHRFGAGISIIGLDRDQDALRRSEERLRTLGAKFTLENESFRNLGKVLDKNGVSSVDAILLDIGLSSDQVETSGRGFSFLRNEPLLMTMSETPAGSDLTAEKVLNTFSEEALELIIRGFGEERYSRRIAAEIVRRREEKPFKVTFELVEAIESAVPGAYKHGKIHPATRTFQAIRIAVNEELAALEEAIPKAIQALKPGGRLAIITFHSLEDRVVKNLFRHAKERGEVEILAKKPITASKEEVQKNPRARSAKLRFLRRK